MKKYILILIFIYFGANLFAQTNVNKGFIGIAIGPSFPLGDFAKTGYSSNLINFGYRFGQNFGICASVFYNQNDVNNSSADMWWGLAGYTVGPMFSLPVKDKFFFDLKAKLGWVTAQLVIDDYVTKKNIGTGLGIDLRASFRYNFSRRWSIFTEAGYLSSNQKFQDGREEKMQVIILGLGIAVNFKLN